MSRYTYNDALGGLETDSCSAPNAMICLAFV